MKGLRYSLPADKPTAAAILQRHGRSGCTSFRLQQIAPTRKSLRSWLHRDLRSMPGCGA